MIPPDNFKFRKAKFEIRSRVWISNSEFRVANGRNRGMDSSLAKTARSE
jgi:hypothetical protein